MDGPQGKTAPIEISSYTPPFLRWGLGAFGVFLIIVPLHDLGRALWPINIFTPFFGLMLGVAIAMGSLLLVAVIWGPDSRWVIADGHVSIVYQRFGKVLNINHPHTDFQSSSVEASESDSGPDTYFLALRLTPEIEARRVLPEFAFLPAVLVQPIIMVRNHMTGNRPGLISPHFKQRSDAEAALARLMRR